MKLEIKLLPIFKDYIQFKKYLNKIIKQVMFHKESFIIYILILIMEVFKQT